MNEIQRKLKKNFSSIKNIETYPANSSDNINVVIYLDAKEDKKNMDIMKRYIFENYHSINEVKFVPMVKIKNKWKQIKGEIDV